ncbi:MAG: hypothetical protein ACI93N_001736 [Flavobacteriaceae bacterium]|jgi:hypothetical protein
MKIIQRKNRKLQIKKSLFQVNETGFLKYILLLETMSYTYS